MNVCFRLNLISEVPQPVYKSSYREADIVFAVQKMYVCTQAECIHESTLFYTMDPGRVIIPFKQCRPFGCSLDTMHLMTCTYSFRYPQDFLLLSPVPEMSRASAHFNMKKSLWNVCTCNKQDVFVKAVIFWQFFILPGKKRVLLMFSHISVWLNEILHGVPPLGQCFHFTRFNIICETAQKT